MCGIHVRHIGRYAYCVANAHRPPLRTPSIIGYCCQPHLLEDTVQALPVLLTQGSIKPHSPQELQVLGLPGVYSSSDGQQDHIPGQDQIHLVVQVDFNQSLL